MTQDELKALELEALELEALIEDLRLNHEYCPKEVILQAADELERLSQRTEQEPVAHCEAGPEFCQQCHKESLPTYGSEEVSKLREVIQSQAKIIADYEKQIDEPAIYPEEAYEMGLEAIAYYTHPPQRTEQNFCPRCGKRTNDIHTCTPPHRTEQEPVQEPYKGLSEHMMQATNGRVRIDPVTGNTGIGTPPQRTWIGLTDEEVGSYWGWEDFQCGCGKGTLLEMVRDIAAKLKERNT